MALNTLNTHCFAPGAGDAYSSFFTLPNAYSSRRPTLATRTASPLALVLHHLILDMLTRLWRRTSPTHPYPTVTYGEWYDFHDPSSLMSPPQVQPSRFFTVSLSSPHSPPQYHTPAGSSRCQCDAYQNNLGNTHQCGAINLKSNQITGRNTLVSSHHLKG